MAKGVTLLIKPASGLCNMQCGYCFYADVSEKRKIKNYGIMQPGIQQAMVTAALRYAEKFCCFAFQGGEPTLAGLDYFKRHVKLQKNYNIREVRILNTIQTNGYAINDEWAKFFSDNRFLVGLSLDGPENIHNLFRVDAKGEGTFAKVMHAAELLTKHRVEFNILTVVNREVAEHGKDVYEFFKAEGFRYLQFIPCLDDFGEDGKNVWSLTPKAYGKFLCDVFDCYYADFKRKKPVSVRLFDNYVGMLAGRPPESCGMSGFCSIYFMVEADGSVYPCDFYVLDEYRMGNVILQRFDQIIQSENAKQFIRESRHIDDNCRACKYVNLCRGGCRRNREPFLNGKPGLNRYCSSLKTFFEHSLGGLKDVAAAVMGNQNRVR